MLYPQQSLPLPKSVSITCRVCVCVGRKPLTEQGSLPSYLTLQIRNGSSGLVELFGGGGVPSYEYMYVFMYVPSASFRSNGVSSSDDAVDDDVDDFTYSK